jgi:predicted ester cyclase
MSIEANKSTVRRFFEEVFNQDNDVLLDELFHPDYRGSGDPHHGPRGPERARRGVAYMRAAFPDIRFSVEHLVGEGDEVVVYVTFRGTHRGSFLGIAPTGKTVEVRGAEMARLQDGLIVEEVWHLYDLAGLIGSQAHP